MEIVRHKTARLPAQPRAVRPSVKLVLRLLAALGDHALRRLSGPLGRLQQHFPVRQGRHADDLDRNWEVLAEPIQTVMRKVGMDRPYERLKELTRGRRVTAEVMRDFIKGLPLPKADKDRLLKMTPANYVGLAAKLARLG